MVADIGQSLLGHPHSRRTRSHPAKTETGVAFGPPSQEAQNTLFADPDHLRIAMLVYFFAGENRVQRTEMPVRRPQTYPFPLLQPALF